MKKKTIFIYILLGMVLTEASLFKKKDDDDETKPTKKPFFGEEGVLKEKVDQFKHKVHDDMEKFKHDLKTKPLIAVELNAKVSVLGNSVGGGVDAAIGAHQTGAHAEANADVMGQKGNAHIGILNGGRPRPPTEEESKPPTEQAKPTETKLVQKLKDFLSKNKNKKSIESGNTGSLSVDGPNGMKGQFVETEDGSVIFYPDDDVPTGGQGGFGPPPNGNGNIAGGQGGFGPAPNSNTGGQGGFGPPPNLNVGSHGGFGPPSNLNVGSQGGFGPPQGYKVAIH